MKSEAAHLHAVVGSYLSELDREELNERYFTDPTLWAKDHLGIKFYWKQQEISQSVVDNEATAVKAGHGVGKSFWASIIVCWWIDTRPINRVFVASTAPSADQVTGVIWREIRKAYQLSHERYARYLKLVEAGKDTTGYADHPLPGYITMDNKWKDDLGNIIAQGRKPPDSKAEDAFQGFHDGHVLAIGDEACGLSKEMIDGLDNITTNANSRRILIGNPTNPASHFGHIFKADVGVWSLHTISVMDSPNFHGGGRCACHKNEPLGLGMSEDSLSKLTNEGFVEGKKKEYGEGSPRYMSRVLGEFAYDAGNTLFSEFDLAQGRNAVVFPDMQEPYLVLGVDVARMGNDSTVIYQFERGTVQATHPETGETLGRDLISEDTHEPVRGGKLRFVDSWQKSYFTSRVGPDGKLLQGTSERIDEWARALGAKEVRVDASGLGGGVLDPLYVLCKGDYIIIEVFGGGASPDLRQYANQRAFRYSEMRRMVFQGEIDLDPQDEELIDECGGLLYSFNKRNAMLIEGKDDMKKRGVKSPDFADAALYACSDYSAEVNAIGQAGDVVHSNLEDYEPSSIHEYSW